MEHLWAPWRSSYILGETEAEPGCLFCVKLARGPERFREELILCETAEAFVIMNKFPYNNGHLMVVPRAHVASPASLDEKAHAALFRLATASLEVLGEVFRPAGLNLGMNLGRAAGAGIADHCHIHLVPRWDGDTNFMPVLAETKVISQHLTATYDSLLTGFAALPGVIAAGRPGTR